MKRLAFAALAVLLSVAACKEQRDAWTKLKTSRDKLAVLFAPAEVGLTIDIGKTIIVDVTNSKLNSAGEEVRAARAREAAALAATLYPEAQEYDVNFYAHTGGFGVNVTTTVASYAFKPEELRAEPK